DPIERDPIGVAHRLAHRAGQPLLEAHLSSPSSSPIPPVLSRASRSVPAVSRSRLTSKTSPGAAHSGNSSRGTSKLRRPSGYRSSTAQPSSSNLSTSTLL